MNTTMGICARKQRFGTFADAWAAASAATITLRVYRCGVCRRYHLTSRTKGMRIPQTQMPG